MLIRVASVSEMSARRPKLVHTNGLDIAIFSYEGKYFAINNVCAHQHFSLLHQGIVEGSSVTCPMHGWKYDFRTGMSLDGEGKVPSYDVVVKENDIFIDIPNEDADSNNG